jgi:hypothetical protein
MTASRPEFLLPADHEQRDQARQRCFQVEGYEDDRCRAYAVSATQVVRRMRVSWRSRR